MWLPGQSCGCRAGGFLGPSRPPRMSDSPSAGRAGTGMCGTGAGWLRGWQAWAPGPCSRGVPAWAEVMGEAALTDVISLHSPQRCPLTARTPCPVIVPVPSMPKQLPVTSLPMGTSRVLQAHCSSGSAASQTQRCAHLVLTLRLRVPQSGPWVRLTSSVWAGCAGAGGRPWHHTPLRAARGRARSWSFTFRV